MELGECFLVSLGWVALLYCAWKLLAVLQLLFPKAWYPLPKSFFSSLGEWAVITGGSEGIGRAYAFELAKCGLNIVLISRTLEKLQTAAKEIGEATGREVKLITADFTKDDIYEHIEENLTGLNVGVLVNNVGILPSRTPCKLLDTKDLEQQITNLLNCNIKGIMKVSFYGILSLPASFTCHTLPAHLHHFLPVYLQKCISVCLSVFTTTYSFYHFLPAYLDTCLCEHLYHFLLVYLDICLSVQLHNFLHSCMSTCTSICLCAHQSTKHN
ncbi:17-beta-hydroxysteroid dehydrogenase type 3 isoform X2 [Conger conger]|uniref:17-beta-hydroxysteroid dehydrogenase type 3 isoform X2 n=1 Tax=Conger conger TaxID=82655 RepID=UPI002A59E4B1|nr:17-beta-hydroxysteroid dehydrogenase type 3 isoform X2 [Conger conger]